MLNLTDCMDLADISDAEIAAIARHEKIPPIAALELGHHLVQTPEGARTLRRFILEDFMAAKAGHRCRDCEAFSRALAAYLEKHPDCRENDPRERVKTLECLAIGACDAKRGCGGEKNKARENAILCQIREAKENNDCCACVRLSLELSGKLSPKDGAARRESG